MCCWRFLSHNFFQTYYAILIDAKRADTDAIIMLENIKVLNYDNGNRRVGFDNNEMREILKVFYFRTH